MRSEIAQPCCGPRATVFRISKSSVPCGRSICSSVITSLLLLQEERTRSLVEVQGESLAVVKSSVPARFLIHRDSSRGFLARSSHGRQPPPIYGGPYREERGLWL